MIRMKEDKIVKKIWKRLLSALLVAVMLLGIAMPQQAFASTVRLNRSSLELYTGYSAPLVLKNAENVKWSSSSKAVAKVSSKGVVTAVDEGSCSIRAYDQDTRKTYTCTVKVRRKAFSLTQSMGTAKKDGTVYSLSTLKNYIKSELGDTIGSDVQWTSSDASIVYVTEDRGLCAVSCGEVVLTAEMRGRTYIYMLTIKEEPAANRSSSGNQKK